MGEIKNKVEEISGKEVAESSAIYHLLNQEEKEELIKYVEKDLEDVKKTRLIL